jgi:hypothetical protein
MHNELCPNTDSAFDLLHRLRERSLRVSSDVPADQVLTGMDGNAKSLVFCQKPISSNKPLDDVKSGISASEVFPLVEISNQLAEVVLLPAELSEFPVNDEYLPS